MIFFRTLSDITSLGRVWQMVKSLAKLSPLLLIAAAEPSAPVSVPQASEEEVDLSRLTGDWIMEENGGWTRETWGVPTTAEIAGSRQSSLGSKSKLSRKMRIAKDKEGVIKLFVKRGRSNSEKQFKLTQTNYGSWYFDNPKRGNPRRITYSREGGWLFVKAVNAGGVQVESFVYRRANPPPATLSMPVPNIEQVESAVTSNRRCIDTGYILCDPLELTKIRNLVCWPFDDLKGHIEPYRSSPAAECSFESHTVPLVKSYPSVVREVKKGSRASSISRSDGVDKTVVWRASWARLHFIETDQCPGKFCKRIWYFPRN